MNNHRSGFPLACCLMGIEASTLANGEATLEGDRDGGAEVLIGKLKSFWRADSLSMKVARTHDEGAFRAVRSFRPAPAANLLLLCCPTSLFFPFTFGAAATLIDTSSLGVNARMKCALEGATGG